MPLGGPRRASFTYVHLIWILARPLIDWVAMATQDGDDAGPWTEAHGTCLSLLAPDFDCDPEGGDDLSLEAFADHAALLMSTHLHMDIQGPTLAPTIAPLLAHGLPACPASVHLVMLSRATWAPFIGNALHSTLTTKVLALAARVAEPVPAASLESQLKSEVWDLLAAQRPAQTWVDEAPLILPAQPPLKRSRTSENLETSLAAKTEQLRMSLGNKVGFMHMVNTLVDAQRVLARLRGSEMVEASLAVDDLFSRDALRRHLRVLDAALDAWQRQEWSRRRDADPEGWGLAVATDESPPSQPRFGGLRFQVTLVYAPLWKPEETWDDSLDPPWTSRATWQIFAIALGKTV